MNVRQDMMGFWVPAPMTPDEIERCLSREREMAERQTIANLRNFFTDILLSRGENPDDYLATEYFTSTSEISSETLRGIPNPSKELLDFTVDAGLRVLLNAFGEGATYIVIPRDPNNATFFVLVRADEYAFRGKLAGARLFKISECYCWTKLQRYF